MKNQSGKMNWLNSLTPVQILILLYLVAVLISTFLISLPIAYQEGVSIAFIDKVFTAVSALSVTGLSTISLEETFSVVGLILITVILHLGAVGIMAISTLIWLLFGKKIGFQERRLIMTDQNQTNFKGMVRLIKEITILLLTVEVIAVLILGTHFLNYYPTASEAYFHGYFATISAISNGGFDITGASMMPFQNDYFIQSIVIFLIIFGAIGFPVLIEIKEFLLRKQKKRFSLYFKVTTLTFFILIIIGAIGIYILDFRNYFLGASWHESFFYAFFQSVTTRSGGLSTLQVHELTEPNQLFISFLMFIGASPSSAGGGIRTTTFALVMVFIIAYMFGRKRVNLFGREIHNEDLLKAVMITLIALSILFVSTISIAITDNFSLTKIVFEATSAFGTVGLSTGITEELSVFSKIILMFLMFIGRVGILTVIFILKPKRSKDNYHYPKERILIG